jgi:hypothetical protein
MYQTKMPMSTAASINRRAKYAKTGLEGSWKLRFRRIDQAVFDGPATGVTWVTCPILRPGRGVPLP